MENNCPPAIAPAHGRGLAALALAMLLASLGVSVATVALPTLARDFSAPVAHVQWVILAYLLAVTVAIVSGGRLGDLIGHRPVLLAGLGVFAAASAACAAAPTLGALIVARAAQGVGGAILMALPISIIRDMVPKERTGAAMGLMMTMSAVGTALGPSLGGLMIAWSGWRAAFLVLAIVGAAVLVFAVRGIPAPQCAGPRARGSLDLPGAFILALTLTAYSLAVTGGSDGFDAKSGVLLLGAAVGVVVFVVIERRRDMPLVQLAALRNRTTSAALLMNLLVSAVMMATLVVGPFYLTFALGLNEALAGLVMAVGPVTAALAGVPAGRITDRFGAPRVLLLGLVQTTAGLLCLAVLPALVGIAGYVLSLMLLTPGFQLFLAANNTSVMTAAPDSERGMISGLLGLSRNLGLMTGASVMGAVFALAVGRRDIAQAAPDAIGTAFSVTFLVAAGLTVVAALTALIGRPSLELRETQAELR